MKTPPTAKTSAAKGALVTGATGMVGTELCGLLARSGWRVCGIASTARESAECDRLLRHDLSDPRCLTFLEAELKHESIEVIWHLAGKAHALTEVGDSGGGYERVNVGCTQTIIDLAERLGVRRLVLASSVKAMGEGSESLQDETAPCLPLTPYGRSKLRAEDAVRAAKGVPEGVILRFCMIYGGADRGNFGRMVRAVRKGYFPPLPETGNLRSLLHVRDAAQACLLAGTRSEAIGEVFIVTDGNLYSTTEMWREIRLADGKSIPRFWIPLALLRALAAVGTVAGTSLRRRMPLDLDSLAKLLDSSAYSSDKIRHKLGFQPVWDLRAALREDGAVIAGVTGGERANR
jgi:UDP-glucose 4-epimerase